MTVTGGTSDRIGAVCAATTGALVTGASVLTLLNGGQEGWVMLALGWGVFVPLAAGVGVLACGTVVALSAVADTESGRGERTDPERSAVRETEFGSSGRF